MRPHGLQLCSRRAPITVASAFQRRGMVIPGMSPKNGKLQELWSVARAVFAAGPTPSRAELLRVQEAFRAIPLSELGVTPPPESALEPTSTTTSTSGRRPPVTYLHIEEDGPLSLGIFCLPQSACIPLHNHPEMTVFSRVLYGTMHVRAYDWAEPSSSGAAGGIRPAQLVVDRRVRASDDASVLFPSSGGNMHAFTALTDCAVLDLLTPPYAPQGGRDCTYYAEHHEGFPPGMAGLLAVDPPGDFVVRRGQYAGAKPQKSAWRLFS